MTAKAERVDALFAKWRGSDGPGAVVAVVQNGGVIHQNAFGMASIEHGIPNASSTRFRIASVSKQFMVTVVMMLVAEGKLALSDSLRQHDRELAPWADSVTIRHALSMNSGMRDFLDVLDWSGTGFERAASAADLRTFILAQRELNYPPGEMFIYTNTGFFLVNELIERIENKPMAEVLIERIFDPLGMDATRLIGDWHELVPDLATPHLKMPSGGYVRAGLGVPISCEGGLVSTLDDLLKWERNFSAPKVGSQAIFDEMAAPTPYNNGTTARYGMGLQRWDNRGQTAISHGGLLPGFRTEFTRYPELGLSIIITGNVDALDPHAKARRIAAIYLGDKLRPVPAAPAKDNLAGHFGLYRCAANDDLMEILWEDGEPRARRFGGNFPLLQDEPGVFQLMHGVFDMQLRFDAGPNRVNAAISGTPHSYERVERQTPPDPVLDSCVGTYRSDELLADFVVRRGAKGLEMRVQGELGREDYHLMPQIPDLFVAVQAVPRYWYPFEPLIRFERDGGGAVTMLVGTSDRGKNMRAPKIR